MNIKQEILQALEFYKNNTEDILGENDEVVKTINNCISLTKEIKEEIGCWENVKIIDGSISARCSKCKLFVKYPYITSFYLYDYCPNCGVSMRGQ